VTGKMIGKMEKGPIIMQMAELIKANIKMDRFKVKVRLHG